MTYVKLCEGYEGKGRQVAEAWLDEALAEQARRATRTASERAIASLRARLAFRSLPWYRRAWLTLTGKAPR